MVALELLTVLALACAAGLGVAGWVAAQLPLIAAGAGAGAAGVVLALGAWRAESMTGRPDGAAVPTSAS